MATVTEKQLMLISKAWGRQSGYAFFPWIRGDAESKEERIKGYHEGPGYLWPRDKQKILDHLDAHKEDDVYWCPSLFEKSRRVVELAMDEHCLWADLDEVDPGEIQDYPPTIAWETSPGRYQGLWLVSGGDVQGASWQGGENQRLTYYLGADVSGWDTTQLLRIPGWANHKPDYKVGGEAPKGKLLWANGRRYLPDDFNDLPEVQTMSEVTTVLEDEVSNIDRHEVWGKVRLKLPHRARELFSAREVAGDRSEQLWWLMRCLADVGCTATEIVAVVRGTVWNKFDGRQDELKRLTIEASKAINQRSEEVTDKLEEEHEVKPEPQNLFDIIDNVEPPEWIVNEILAIGACGFIAGQPKSFKSWVGLDLALSVATGLPFLDHFSVRNPGPVLYIQEEDSAAMVKQRIGKVWPGKQADKMQLVDGKLVWNPPDPKDKPHINGMIRQSVVLSDEGWQAWLDEQLTDGYVISDDEAIPYRMVLIDPLMMVAGDVEENRSQEMTNKLFKPMKVLAEKFQVAFVVVHHMRKGDPTRPQRGGQLMLGSVANHAWAEDSLYLRLGRGGKVFVERESKHTTTGSFVIGRLRNKSWTPTVTDDKMTDDGEPEEDSEKPKSNGQQSAKRLKGRPNYAVLEAMNELGPGPHATKVIGEMLGITGGGAFKQLMRQLELGTVTKVGTQWRLTGSKVAGGDE